jgi:hypothetical protein
MSTAHESLEHAEHIAHGAHGATLGKMIGLTMAILGVLLAFCAAEVGAHRTELTKALVEQTQVSTESQANQMKYRLVMLELEKISAATAPGGEPAKGEKTEADHAQARTLDRLLALAVQYIEWKEATKAWVKTYNPVIDAHAESAEGYEHAQLAAEVGIVLASIALLLLNRKIWFVALVMGVLSISFVIRTYNHAHHVLTEGEHAIEGGKEKYAHVRTTFDALAEDAHTLDVLDPGHKHRDAYTAAANARAAEKHKGGEHKSDEHKGGEHHDEGHHDEGHH